MNKHVLSFGHIIIIQDDIAEVIINHGVELDLPMVYEYHAFLLQNLRAPFSVLINKINSYSYTFEAQIELGEIDEIAFIAVISYNQQTENSTNFLASMHQNKERWNMRIFDDRTKGLQWLRSQHKQVQ